MNRYSWNIPTWDRPAPPRSGYPARFWRRADGGAVQCVLCPHCCRIAPGGSGICRVRRNEAGVLVSDVLNHPAAMHVDPIEKKPLAHYLAGSKTFSFGTFGCNLGCGFCQNDSLSRSGSDRRIDGTEIRPREIVLRAQKYNCRSIAFTYNEPTVFTEYAVECAKLARAAGLGTVLVSNGFIAPEPRSELYGLIDAANIDIKSFSDDFYRRQCGGRLAPVLESCKFFKHDCKGHLEITNLLIPGLNDAPVDVAGLLDWIADELGLDTPVHFSAYFPAGGFTAPRTPPETLFRAKAAAEQRGFRRVHLGNL